jgi:hypothetical protein
MSIAVRKGIPHNYVDLPPISVEATGACIPVGNDEVLFAGVYKSVGRPWSDVSSQAFKENPFFQVT